MELQRVISTEGDAEPPSKEFWERITMVIQEERVVAERGHGYVDLGQVIQVLQDWHLQKVDKSKKQYLEETTGEIAKTQ